MTRNVTLLLLLCSFVIAATFAFPSQPFSYHNTATANRRSRHFVRLFQSTFDDHHEQLLLEMTRFFAEDMVDPTTKRFYYLCLPSRGECQHVHFPIRDLAAAWDGTKALEFSYSLNPFNLVTLQQQLKDAVKSTLTFYSTSFCYVNQLGGGGGGGVSLDETLLLEAPNIGHSAMLLLGTCSALRLGILQENEIPLDGLTRGILSMQLENGAFGIDFANEKNFLRGIEFFPGEAMLALMHVYMSSKVTMSQILEDSTQAAILPAMERAFDFYSQHYRTADVDINYNIWQALAFAKLYDALPPTNLQQQQRFAEYVLNLCQEICQSRSWKYQLARGKSFFINVETVEIACGLDALAEGSRIAQLEQNEDMARLFQIHTRHAVDFLQWAQDQVPLDRTVGRGGLGYGGIQVLEQRIDVTGHAISALTKLRQLSMRSKTDN
jgi:hypothetical protein